FATAFAPLVRSPAHLRGVRSGPFRSADSLPPRMCCTRCERETAWLRPAASPPAAAFVGAASSLAHTQRNRQLAGRGGSPRLAPAFAATFADAAAAAHKSNPG